MGDAAHFVPVDALCFVFIEPAQSAKQALEMILGFDVEGAEQFRINPAIDGFTSFLVGIFFFFKEMRGVVEGKEWFYVVVKIDERFVTVLKFLVLTVAVRFAFNELQSKLC